MWDKFFRRQGSSEKASHSDPETPSSVQTKSQSIVESGHSLTNGDNIMSDELVTPENLSKELLHSIFSAAFMETSWDSEGDLRVKDQISCFVIPSPKKDRIRLLAMLGFKKTSSEMQRLECVNKINNEHILVRATSSKNDTLVFDHDISVVGVPARRTLS